MDEIPSLWLLVAMQQDIQVPCSCFDFKLLIAQTCCRSLVLSVISETDKEGRYLRRVLLSSP